VLKPTIVMRKLILISLYILFANVSFANNPFEVSNSLWLDNNKTELNLNNYQQFKFQVVNFESKDHVNYANLQRRRKKKSDDLMLYVAGGLAVATVTLILTNNPENFTSNSSSGVNLGIAVGGTVACGLIVTKYFVDKRR